MPNTTETAPRDDGCPPRPPGWLLVALLAAGTVLALAFRELAEWVSSLNITR